MQCINNTTNAKMYFIFVRVKIVLRSCEIVVVNWSNGSEDRT